MKKFDTIENLFIEEFQDVETPLNLEEIELMDKLIIKNSFYKFMPYQFNAYYAAAILTSVLINTVFIYHYMYSTHVIKKTIYTSSQADTVYTKSQVEETSIVNKKPTVYIQESPSHTVTITTEPKSTVLPESVSNNKIHAVKTLPETAKLNNSATALVTTTEKPIQAKTPDILHVTDNQTIESTKTETKIKPQKKIVYITRKDTILQIDTVKTGRRRKSK